VPHAHVYLLPREDLLKIVERDELDLDPAYDLGDDVALVQRPRAAMLESTSAAEMRVYLWRLLFHARIHAVLQQQAAVGWISAAQLRQRIQRLGRDAFEEIRNVLQQEEYLLPPGDDLTVYVELAATLLELYYFDRALAERMFPALEDLDDVVRLLGDDVDHAALLAETHPAGARLPAAVSPPNIAQLENWELWGDPEALAAAEEAREPSEEKFHRWMNRAEGAAAKGNVVGSALCRSRAHHFASRKTAGKARAAIRGDVRRLIARLAQALELPAADAEAWEQPLGTLVIRGAQGLWPVEARLLYDLQKICLAAERDTYTVDLVEWALSWGRRPIKRPLPSQRDVLMSKYLRSALRKLAAARVPDPQRQELARLLRAAQTQVTCRMEDRFRPQIEAVLDDVHLRPANLPERVSRVKLVEELLDRIGERDFLTMADLRDGLSRNNLKLPDIASPGEFFGGDALLRADRRLAVALDGVYRRAEFYLRGMQRLTGLAFGTPVGRFLVRWGALPFGGAYLALAGLDHLAELILRRDVTLNTALNTVLAGIFALGLLHWPAFRQTLWGFLKAGWPVVRGLFVDLPRWLVDLPLLERIVHSRWFTLTARYVIKPGLWTAGICLAWTGGEDRGWSASSVLLVFVVVDAVLNSRLGRNLEQLLIDALIHTWRRFGLRLVYNLFWFTVDLFKGILENTERLLYTVDEWLQFHTGEGRATLVTKAVLGLVWFLVTYVIRFCVTLLIEPQINPIKHFPVVTVSHKLLLPFIPTLARVLSYTMEYGLAVTVAGGIIAGIPGIFGFLVWELKENWRLYAANRPGRLRPVAVGDHGETMLRLLRPGFHSGTIPKRFAKLRRAEETARRRGRWTAVAKQLHLLHHLRQGITRFFEREFVELFRQTPRWHGAPPRVGGVALATNRVRVDILGPADDDEPWGVEFAFRYGWLTADVGHGGWTLRLPPEERRVVHQALAGLLHLAGVQLVRQQCRATFGQRVADFDLDPRGLVVWPEATLDDEAYYDLQAEPLLIPQLSYGFIERPLPILQRSDVLFAEPPLGWDDWVAAWDPDRPGSNVVPPWMEGRNAEMGS